MVKVSIVNSIFVRSEQRLDAEHYEPEFLSIMETLQKLRTKLTVLPLSSREITPRFIKSMIVGDRTIHYGKIGTPFIRVSDIKELSIDTSKIKFLMHTKGLTGLAKAKPHDVVISKSGTIASVGVIPEDYPEWYLSDDLICLRTNINPYYLAAFLECKYGKLQVLRGRTQQVQMKVSIENLRKVLVPILPKDFQLHIEQLVKQAYEKRKLAEQKYQQAEELLYELLGIDKEEIEKLEVEKSYETNFKEVKQAFRFDAEYYHPKYLGILDLMKKVSFKVKPLKEVAKISNETTDPTKELYKTKKFKYVPIAKINESGEIFEWDEFYGWQAPSRGRMVIRKGDILIPSLSGTFDKIALVPEELDGQLATTGCFVVRAKNDYPEFLFLLFRSPLFKRQLERLTTGAIMSAVPKTIFGSLLIPDIPKDEQQEITNLVKEYFKLRKEARQLVQRAIREVEEAIKNASRTNGK